MLWPLKLASFCVAACLLFWLRCAVISLTFPRLTRANRNSLIESTVAPLLRRDDRCDKSQHTQPSVRGDGGGGGGGNTSVAGHSVVEADGPYGLLPLSTGCSSAPLIWQEWHLRRGSKLRFNEQRTLLNSLCADRTLHLLPPPPPPTPPLAPRFPMHVNYGDERAAVPLHNKGTSSTLLDSSLLRHAAFTATFRRRNANVGISPRRANTTTAGHISIHKWRCANAYFISCTHVMSTLTALLSRQSSHHCH